jgi:hypothetical protein
MPGGVLPIDTLQLDSDSVAHLVERTPARVGRKCGGGTRAGVVLAVSLAAQGLFFV